MVRSQHAQAVGEHPLEQRNRLANATRRFIRARKVVARGERAGVVRPQNAQTVGEHLLEQGDRLNQTAH